MASELKKKIQTEKVSNYPGQIGLKPTDNILKCLISSRLFLLAVFFFVHTQSQCLALFRLFPSASLLVAHLGLNPVRVS